MDPFKQYLYSDIIGIVESYIKIPKHDDYGLVIDYKNKNDYIDEEGNVYISVSRLFIFTKLERINILGEVGIIHCSGCRVKELICNSAWHVDCCRNNIKELICPNAELIECACNINLHTVIAPKAIDIYWVNKHTKVIAPERCNISRYS